ncbi:MAG TPA: hypothetical protein VGM90_29430 [Kofleriaceae bacterium]|jgi:hypothetical protein
MKALVLFGVMLASNAANAEGTKILLSADSTDRPVSIGKVNDEGELCERIVASRVIAKVHITLVHSCGVYDESGYMVFRVGDEYLISVFATLRIRFRQLEFPVLLKDLISDRIYPGTLVGGGPAVVQAVATRHEHMPGMWRTVGRNDFGIEVQACGLVPTPACAVIGEYECAPKGCAPPTLKDGVVRVVDGAGKVHETTLAVESL